MGYLNNDGLLYLWTKIKSTFVAQESGKGLSTNDYTTTEKNKLSGIATGATKNTVENVLTSDSTTNALSAAQGKALKALIDGKGTGNGDMLKSTYDTNGNGIVDNAEKVNGKTVEVDVPANAKFTDTKYIDFGVASSTADGASGLVPAPKKGQTADEYFLGADGTWHQLWGEINRDASKVYVSVYGGGSNNVMEDGYIPFADASYPGTMSPAMFTKLNALPTNATLESTYAKKSDITNMYKYKGSVATESALPTTGLTAGDVYDIQSASSYGGAGMNVAWTGSKWDALGEIFSITSITNAEIDTICV